MNPIAIVFLIQLVLAGGGIYVVRYHLTFRYKPDASQHIDHPSKKVRFLYRALIFGFCNFLSLVVTALLLNRLTFLPSLEIKESSELIRAGWLLLFPVPLALVFYQIIARLERRITRRNSSPR